MFTELGEMLTELGELYPELGELFPELGELFPELGEMFTELGELFPELGEMFLELGEMFPDLGEMHTRLHTPRHILSPVILGYNTVLYNIYVPVINFDRAQFLTDTRANIVDVQLCMDFVKCLTTSSDPNENRWRPHMGSRPTGWETLFYSVPYTYHTFLF